MSTTDTSDELEKILSKLPETIKYKDGKEMVSARLGLHFHKCGTPRWTIAYYCAEYDYIVMCGYGKTAVEAANHLLKLYKKTPKKNGVVSGQ